MGHEKSAGFLIIRRLNAKIEYLLLKASEMGKNWTPPKGHVEPGEDDLTTALRETREEAGFNADDLHIYKDQYKALSYKVNGNNKTVLYWLAELKDPHKNPKLSHEHTEFRWLEKEDAIALSGFADFAEMVNHFHDKIDNLKMH